MRPRRLAQEDVSVTRQFDELIAIPGVTAVDERGTRRIRDTHAVGLGGVAYLTGQNGQRADLDGLVVDPVPDFEDVGEVVDLAALGRRCGAQARPGVAGP